MISLHEGRLKASLNGTWKYAPDTDDAGVAAGYYATDYDDQAWPTMELPTNWYLTELGDFFGTVWFRRSFSVPSSFAGQRVFLRFAAVDYYADVWLNGRYLGSHEGMFNSFEFDITDAVDRSGDNVLVVKDGAPRDPTEYIQATFPENPLSPAYQRHQAKAISMIKGHMIDAMHRPGAMTKFRQDGNSGGIWDDVELVARPAVYIDYARMSTRIGIKKDWLGDGFDKPDGTGLVAIDLTLVNTTSQVVETDVVLGIAPANFDGPAAPDHTRHAVLPPGVTTMKIFTTVHDAHLWWTWDQGRPDMYVATIRAVDDQVSVRFAIKDIRHDDATGQWYLNGKRLFLLGMRFISSQWLCEGNEAMWADDLGKMLDMQINSVRIGSHVEKDGFYTMCDELGLLVWQVFPLHYCVSDADDFVERASDMIRDMGQMLTNHPCIGMWSVYKEPEIYLLPDKPNNYHRLCQVLKETLASVDPVRWIHLGDYREGVQNLMIGGVHDGDTHMDELVIEPQIVEFGAASIPVRESLEKFIPAEALWPPDWDTWEYHGLFYELAFKGAKIELGSSLDEFIDNYQAYEALVVKEQIEFIRQRKYAPVASMYLYYWSDSCPIIGSGLFDYYRRPYQAYAAMKAVYTKVLISLEREVTPYILAREKVYQRNDSFVAKVWVTNDLDRAIEQATVNWAIENRSTGAQVASKQFTTRLAPDSAEPVDHVIWPIPATADLGEYRVHLTVTDGDGTVLSANYTDIVVR